MNQLFQKRGFSRREFHLSEKTVRVKTWSITKNQEFEVKLEHLGNQIVYESTPTIARNIVAGIFLSIPCMLLVISLIWPEQATTDQLILNFICWPLLVGIIYINPEKSDLHIVGGSHTLTFYQASPSKETVNEFVHEIIERSNRIILNKYGKVDPDLPEDTQMNLLHWLKDRELISESEYESLKLEYKTRKLL